MTNGEGHRGAPVSSEATAEAARAANRTWSREAVATTRRFATAPSCWRRSSSAGSSRTS